jgi:hypothetical protein
MGRHRPAHQADGRRCRMDPRDGVDPRRIGPIGRSLGTGPAIAILSDVGAWSSSWRTVLEAPCVAGSRWVTDAWIEGIKLREAGAVERKLG